MDKDSAEYKKAKKLADDKYERNGAYKSMYISKMYHKFCNEKNPTVTKVASKKKGLVRWIDEQWIQVIPYLDGNIVKCGANKDYCACRPLIRVNEETPITVVELVKLHGKKKLRAIAMKKENNINGRLDWVSGVIS